MFVDSLLKLNNFISLFITEEEGDSYIDIIFITEEEGDSYIDIITKTAKRSLGEAFLAAWGKVRNT